MKHFPSDVASKVEEVIAVIAITDAFELLVRSEFRSIRLKLRFKEGFVIMRREAAVFFFRNNKPDCILWSRRYSPPQAHLLYILFYSHQISCKSLYSRCPSQKDRILFRHTRGRLRPESHQSSTWSYQTASCRPSSGQTSQRRRLIRGGGFELVSESCPCSSKFGLW